MHASITLRIITGQFAEIGTPERKETQAWLKDFTQTSGMRICGPNCLGIANVTDSMWACATSREVVKRTAVGDIALVSQSGATAFGPFLHRAQDRGIGLAYIVSTGNSVDFTTSDIILYCIRQPHVKGIVAEPVPTGSQLTKPIVEDLAAGEAAQELLRGGDPVEP